LNIREDKLGANHPDLADTLQAYAVLLRETNRKSEAKAMDANAKRILAKSSSLKAANQTIDVRELESAVKAWRAEN